MIELEIKDGLGNQLFQYAYARYLQEMYKDGERYEELLINPYYINKHDFRDLSLNNFKLGKHVSILTPEKQKKHMYIFIFRTIAAMGLDLISWKLFKKKPLGEERFLKRAKRGVYYTYRPITSYRFVRSTIKNKYVFGCFQSEKNFKQIEDIIRNELQIITPPSKENAKMIEEINSCNAVCLHIRRGDYLDSRWKELQVCDYHYYNKAINRISKEVENPVFFVFSNGHDDIEWIKKNYNFTLTNIDNVKNNNDVNLDIRYVDLNNPDYEELRLMMNCKHFIISNSTFSWWAAYLANRSKKKVIVPSRWNKAIDDDSDIYIDDWIKIEVN